MKHHHARFAIALAVSTLVLGPPAVARGFPLTRPESTCAGAFIKDSRKVVAAYGKATAACVKDIGSERASAAEPSACVAEDPRGRLAKARARQRATVLGKCLDRPYGMDCGGPCAASDAGGATAAIDDSAELADCLECISPASSIEMSAPEPIERGAHGRILDDVVLAVASASPALARCQADVVRRYDKLFATQIKEADKCAKKALRAPSLVGPPTSCIVAAADSSRVVKARLKLGAAIAACGDAPFEAGACAAVTGHPLLTDCMTWVADCAPCRWGDALLGASLDCDLFDDGLANASCDYDGMVPTTNSTLPAPTTTVTTTTMGGVTTTTLGGGSTTTIAGGSTTTTITATTTVTTGTSTTTLAAGPCGTYLLQFGSLGGGSGLFDGPRGLAVGNAGNVYVADSRNHRAQMFTSSGVWILEWGSQGQGNGEFDRPRGLAVDAAGAVYVADRTNSRIQKFGPGGSHLMTFGTFGTGNGQFNFPRDVAVDGSGNIYVADSGNHRIQKFNAAGTFLTKWGSFGLGDGQFNLPRGITVAGSGDVYVSDRDNHRIQKFTSMGTYLAKWGGFGSGNGQFNGPRGVTTDAAGNLYVVDSGNNRVQVFTSAGTYLNKWGAGGAGNGQFNSPRGIALDGTGGVYVTDLDNNRVQKFSCPVP